MTVLEAYNQLSELAKSNGETLTVDLSFSVGQDKSPDVSWMLYHSRGAIDATNLRELVAAYKVALRPESAEVMLGELGTPDTIGQR